MTDVAALVAEALSEYRARLEEEDPVIQRLNKTDPYVVASIFNQGYQAALDSLSRPVGPPREALAKALFELVNQPFQWGAEAMKATRDAWLTKADALLADADLWQPAPVMDRDALIGILSAEPFEGDPRPDYLSRHDAEWIVDALLPFIGQPVHGVSRDALIEWFQEGAGGISTISNPTGLADAVLGLIGQPVSPRTVTTVEELDALPILTLINENRPGVRGFHLWKSSESHWQTVGGVSFHATQVRLPASVLYVPSEGVES